MLAVLAGGTSDEELVLDESDKNNEPKSESDRQKKTMVVLYDGGDHSDIVLKTASWLEHSGRFKVTVLSIKKKEQASRRETREGRTHPVFGTDWSRIYRSLYFRGDRKQSGRVCRANCVFNQCFSARI